MPYLLEIEISGFTKWYQWLNYQCGYKQQFELLENNLESEICLGMVPTVGNVGGTIR